MSSDIVSGVGARYGTAILLDPATGLPYQATPSATPETGIVIEGIKTASATDPEPQRFTHYGDDFPFAQDSLPPQTVETFAYTTAKSNLRLDAYLEGALVRTYGTDDDIQARLADSNQRGNEPFVMAMFYRQALNTANGAPQFGIERQWNIRIYPATRISPISPSYEAAITDNTYQGTPTNTGRTPWGEDYETSTWGATRGSHIEAVMDYQPRVNVYQGNGTLASFSLTHAPANANNLKLWVGGSLTVPGSITYGATPAFTVSPAVGLGTQIFALIGAANPNQSNN